jgi:Dolichyl-phosphate-mannose-protein mannosyltransferase
MTVEDIARTLASRRAPLIAGAISAGVLWIVWGAIAPLPLIHDEFSYVLQARIFAGGHWTAAVPPIPEFFEQPHVLVVPAVASKYPPGHALLLALGAVVGAPWLLVLIVNAIIGGLVYALGRRIANPWVGAGAWLLWLSSPFTLRFGPSYYSEVTTAALWLAAWWALLAWRASGRRQWLLALAAAIGWGAITRPLTMLAFALPVGVIVLRDVVRRRAWRDLAFATSIGVVILAMLPLWSAYTTGDWRLSPTTLYRRDYLPFDKPGFDVDRTPPARALPPVVAALYRDHIYLHERHPVADVPRAFAERIAAVAKETWGGPWVWIAPFALLGVLAMNGALTFGLVTSLVLFVAYLPYAHWSQWTLYYLEIEPVLCGIAALGIWRAARWLSPFFARARGAAVRLPALGAALVCLLFLVAAATTALAARRTHVSMAQFDESFRATLSTLPTARSIVFVHYEPRMLQHVSVVTNEPDLEAAPVWIVHDRGAENARLLARAPDRTPYVFEETNATLHSMGAAAVR